MTARFTHETSALRADVPGSGTSLQTRAMDRLRATNEHLRQVAVAHRHRPRPFPATTLPVADPVEAEVDVRLDSRWAGSVARLPHSHAVRSACGLSSLLGLLSVDGTLLEADQSVSTPPELRVHDALGRPFWEAPWWIWSPIVQQRLRETVAMVAAGCDGPDLLGRRPQRIPGPAPAAMTGTDVGTNPHRSSGRKVRDDRQE